LHHRPNESPHLEHLAASRARPHLHATLKVVARRLLCSMAGRRMLAMIKLTWLPHWRAYVVRRNDEIIGMVGCKVPIPFRVAVEFA
jgi:hypothetical protein